MCVLSHFSHVWLWAALWTVAHQAPLSMGFSRQESWNRFPCPPPGDLPNPGIDPSFLLSLLLTGRFFITNAIWEAKVIIQSLSLTIFDSLDCSPPDSSVHKDFQARKLEWVTISFFRGSSWIRNWTCVSCTGRQILYPLSYQERFKRSQIKALELKSIIMNEKLERLSSKFGHLRLFRLKNRKELKNMNRA